MAIFTSGHGLRKELKFAPVSPSFLLASPQVPEKREIGIVRVGLTLCCHQLPVALTVVAACAVIEKLHAL